MKANLIFAFACLYVACGHPWRQVDKSNDTNVTVLGTFWAVPGANNKTVNTTTYSTDCRGVVFQPEPLWDNCTEERVTCIWFPNGTVGRGSNCRKFTRFGSADFGQVNAFRGGFVNRTLVNGTNVSTTLFPTVTIDFVEGLPTYVETIVIDDVGIRTLSRDLSRTYDSKLPITARILQMRSNKISSISGVVFSENLQIMDLSFNQIKSIGTVVAPNLLTLTLMFNAIESLAGAVFPATLRDLMLHYNQINSLANVEWPPGLQTLGLSTNKLQTLAFPLPPSLLELRASDMALNNSLSKVTWPSKLRLLSLVNTSVTEITANFPPGLKSLFLWNTNITAFYANESQFRLLSNVTTTCQALDAEFDGDYVEDYCQNLLSTTNTNATCRGHIRIEMLQGKYPICIIPDDKVPITKGTIIYTVCIAGSVLLVVVAVFAHWRKVKSRQKWYNDSGVYYDDNTSTVVTNDIRSDKHISTYRIPPDRIDRGREIGRGGYGVVYVATIKYGGKATRQVAMKRLLPERTHNMADIETFMDEIRTCSSICHANIVEFVGVTWTNLSNLSLVTEYMGAGDVWSLLEKDRDFKYIDWDVASTVNVNLDNVSSFDVLPDVASSRETLVSSGMAFSKLSVLCSVVDALVYLHSLPAPIIHRDVKAKNVLVNDHGLAKLSDFGTSREGTMDYTMTSEIGTIPWIAPEILKGVRYSEKADIYSVGVLISELDTVEVPYANMQPGSPTEKYPRVAKTKIMMMVVAGDLRPCVTHDCPNIIYDIIRRCVAYCPDDRPSARDLQHWLRQIKRRASV